MELVAPSLIEWSGRVSDTTDQHLLTYQALKNCVPVRVDDNMCLLDGDDNVQRLKGYLSQRMKLIPVVRSNPHFKPRPDFPSRVLLEITSRCNSSCSMCPRQQLTRPLIDMEMPVIKRCVDALDAVGIAGLWLYNIGESLLHPGFPELLEYVSTKKNLGSIWHSSNGRELDERFSELIIQSNIKFMNMSVNAGTADTYAKLNFKKIDWDEQVANFNRFIEMKRHSGKRTPFSRVQTIDQALARDEIDLFLSTYAGAADMLVVNTLEAFSQEVENTLADAKQRVRPEKKSCNRVKRQDLMILSNGETTFCNSDFNGTFSMGNVKHQSIFDIWNSAMRKRIVELNAQGDLDQVDLCRDCLDFDL